MKTQTAPPQLPGSRLLLGVTGLMTLALGAVALHTVLTLSELRRQFLENQAVEAAQSLGRAVRGPGRFSNLSHWRSVFEDALEGEQTSLRFAALADTAGRLLVKAGCLPVAAVTVEELAVDGIWFHRMDLAAGRGGPRWADSGGPSAAVLVVGIDESSSAFIQRQALVHVVVTLVAVGVLWTLAFHLRRAQGRLVEAKLREESERHLADLGRMSATLAHEIRNPLGAMKGLSQVIREGLPADHSAQALLETMVTEAERLEKLVNDLLSFARPRKPVLEEVDLAELAGQVAELATREAEGQGLTLDLNLPPQPVRIVTDPNGLRQVLFNGLRNAFEASQPGGKVELAFGLGSRQGAAWIEVRDRGKGLEGIQPEELFRPFHTSKLRDGTGLGLAVCRRIMDALGGQVTLAERPGGGAVFRVELG
jgi:signal transduction histidine kinase